MEFTNRLTIRSSRTILIKQLTVGIFILAAFCSLDSRAQCTVSSQLYGPVGGGICQGDNSKVVTFQGGDTGTQYRLFKNGSPVDTFTGNGQGSVTSWTAVIGVTYQVKGNTGPCASYVSDAVTVAQLTPSYISINASPSGSSCAGDPVTLTAAHGSGFSWTSQTVYPTQTTTYTLTGLEPNCLTSVSANYTVSVAPKVGPVSTPTGLSSFCQGTVTGSQYTATATNVGYYSWSVIGVNPTTSPGSISQTGYVTWDPNFAGTARVIVQASSSNFCNYSSPPKSIDVTINYSPAAPSTPTMNVLYNTSTTLTATGALANEVYTWYTSQTSTTPISPVVGPLNSAASFIYYAGKKNTVTGCETLPGQRSQLIVNLYAKDPVVTTSSNTCGPRTFTFDPPDSGTTYYWLGTSSSYSTTTPIASSYSVSTSGSYYVATKVDNLNVWSSAKKVTTIVDPVDITLAAYDPANPIVQATHSITLGPGFTVPAGSTFNATIVISPECTDLMNWTEQVSYDQSGAVIARGKTYYDGFGNALQSQSIDYLNSKVWTSSTLVDRYGVSVGNTLPAPVLENDFIYKNAFITNAAGQKYSAAEFDKGLPYTNSAGEPTNPNPVGVQPGTVGWYYSSSNNLELKTPVTQYPYSRSFSPEGPDPSQSTTAGPGDNFKMGSSHENKSERYPIVASELTHYYNLRTYFPLATSLATGQGFKYIFIDANGKKAASFVDSDGRNIATAVATGSNGTYTYDYWSYTYYNDAGQVTATVAPKDVNTGSNAKPPATTFGYDQLGRLIETNSPDEGISRFVYSTDGKIRFSENQEQRDATPKRFSYTNYDQLGRLVESGEYSSTSGGFIFEPHTTTSPSALSVLYLVDNAITIPIEQVDGSYLGISQKRDGVRCTDYSFITYDIPGSGSPATQTFLYGQVSKTQNENATTWYSYNEDGLLLWTKQSIGTPEGIGVFGIKTIDYTYDYYGNVTQVAYQAGQTDAFYHHYTYDINQRLTEVRTSKDGVNKTLQAKYYYYLHGPLKRVELAGNLQGMDYVYTINGSLKSINNSDITKDPGADGSSNGFSPDAFGMTFDYHSNDYQGANYNAGTISGNGTTNYYNGIIKSASWFTPVDNPASRKVYKYSYDNLYQFQNADFGSVTPGNVVTLSATGAYNENISLYDKNGNIQGLSRKGKSGNSLANYSYDYDPGTNRLDKIRNGSTTISDYTYNSIGQMTRQTGGKELYVKYNAYGLVKEVFGIINDPRPGGPPPDPGPPTPEDVPAGYSYVNSYYYDDRGELLKKEGYIYNLPTNYYVRDAAGNVMAIYQQDSEGVPYLLEVPIYGAGRIAVYKPAPNTTFYELNDHLGNVRGVIGAPSTENFMATMETEVMASENAVFQNIAPRVVSTAANNTIGGNEAIRINNGDPNGGYPGRSVGPGIVLHVSPGDVISAEVYGYYEGGSGYSNTLPLATIAANVATAFGGVSGALGDPGKLFSSLNTAINAPGFAGAGGSGSDIIPAAYLNMVMLDENMMPDVTNLPNSAAPIPGTANMAKQKISIGPITIPSPGYVYIYVNDNSNSNNWVYFDDLKVTHIHSPFVAGADYYPFGLTMNDREIKEEPYRFGYQGQYSEENASTGWNEFDLRMYDPEIGRWISPDPYKQFINPYLGMANNPVISIDRNGGWIIYYSKADAMRVAKDLNKIFKAKYGVYFDVISVVDKKVKDRDEMGGQLILNNNFNWDMNEYTQALFDVANVDYWTFGSIVGEDQLTPSLLGYTESPGKFLLSKHVPDFPGNKGISIGMVALHENLYHQHEKFSVWSAAQEWESNSVYYHFSPEGKTAMNPIAGRYSGKIYKSLSRHDADPNRFIKQIGTSAVSLAAKRALTSGASKAIRTPRYRH